MPDMTDRMIPTIRFAVPHLLIAAALTWACTGDVGGVLGVVDGGPATPGGPRDSFLPPIVDAADSPRPDSDGGILPGGFGSLCERGTQCQSGYCIEGPDGGRICTRRCADDCPDGFECNAVSNDGPDTTFICVADQPDLCNACESDIECDDNADLCLQIGLRRYCAEDCSKDGQCPDGYECVEVSSRDAGTEVRQCVPAGGEGCQPCRDADGDGYGDGDDCLGFDCDDADPEIYAGAAERCDGRDNNCNSLVDEAESIEPPTIETVCTQLGVCRGSRVACMDGDWGCDFPAIHEPGSEVSCDGLDNDCDGVADDDFDLSSDPDNCAFCANVCEFPHADGLCVGGSCELGPCDDGFFNVDRNHGNGCEYACTLTRDGEEACDGIDNDCDGDTDEDFELDIDAANCGGCNRTCELEHAVPECRGGVCRIRDCEEGWHDLDDDPRNGCELGCLPANPPIEVCNRVDDDCDGDIDEGFDLQTDPSHCGACGRACAYPNGVPACRDGDCSLIGCAHGWLDINNDLADGCEYACVPTRGGVEVCDEIDNDCDGLIDEEFNLERDPEHCGACNRFCFSPNGVTACEGGQCRLADCAPGFWDVDGVPDNGCEYRCESSNGGVERCDATDNDCDGQFDEGFDLLSDVDHCGRCNNPCFLPNATPLCVNARCIVAECVGGFWDVDFRPETGCEYACQPTDGGRESCDGDDNDCDGRIDEDFDTFNDIDHCGACNQRCEIPNADTACRGGRCEFVECRPGFQDLDGRLDNGCEFGCGATDVPDMDGFDANCDGIDGDYARAIFVSSMGRADARGTPDDPLTSVRAAVDLAAQRRLSQVIVADGDYAETVVLRAGVSLYGGYDPEDWSGRNTSVRATRIIGAPIGIIGAEIGQYTEVQGFVITSPDANGIGQSSYAVWIRDSASGMVHFVDNTIRAGDGSDGPAGGDAPVQSVQQLNGDNGGGSRGGDGGSGGGEGGTAGGSACGRSGGGGGRGGYGSGASGGGSTGTGGTSGGVPVGAGCGVGGDAGRDGAAGTPGRHGSGGSGGGRVINDFWVGDDGENGNGGGHGNGGGGGSGGSGTTECTTCSVVPCRVCVDFLGCSCLCNGDRGGGGGGGGGGACGGNPAGGGGAGGASFGIFVLRSDIRLTLNVIEAGDGGRGGHGGRANRGGSPGGGGGGGDGPDDAGDGARGGNGGPGGCGGHGGGGSGGASFAIYTVNAEPEMSENTLVQGRGGQGGGSGCQSPRDGDRFCCERFGNLGRSGLAAARGGD